MQAHRMVGWLYFWEFVDLLCVACLVFRTILSRFQRCANGHFGRVRFKIGRLCLPNYRWIQLDPHAWYAILRYTALFEEYYTTNPLRVTSFVEMVLNVIEYICPEDNDIAKSLYLWKKLDANFGMYKSCTTYDVLENRKWWCDYFFQVPNTMKQDELELCAYKATILKELCMKQYKSFIYVAMQNLNAVTDAKDLYDPIYQLYVQHGMMHDQVDSPLIATNQVMKNKIMRVPRILERKKVFQSEIYAARITEIPHEENMVSYLETELTQSEIATVINGLN